MTDPVEDDDFAIDRWANDLRDEENELDKKDGK